MSPNYQRSQGAQANLNGKIFEDMCIPLLAQHGFIILSYKEFETMRKLPVRYVVQQMPYITIYGHKGRTEMVIVDQVQNRVVRVENKYQQAAGSVDEKYPYMYLNAVFAYEEPEVIFVIDGGGFKPGAKKWLIDRINENWLDYRSMGKSIQLMTIAEFINWVNRNF